MRELEAELIGSFDLIDTARLSTSREFTERQIGAAYIHEEGHRKLVSSTGFGEIQQVLAYISKHHLTATTINWLSSSRDLLELTISHSFYTHEGYAVFRQIFFSDLYKQPVEITLLPKYLDALKKYQAIAALIPETFSGAKIGLVHFIAETSLNSDILSIVNPDELFASTLRDYLQNEFNQPDYRLDTICNLLMKVDVVTDLEQDLMVQFHLFKEKYKLQKEMTFTSFIEHSFTNPNNVNISLYEIWQTIETNFYHGLLSKLKLPFTFHHPLDMQDIIETYHVSLKNYFESSSLDMFGKRRSKGRIDTLIQSDNVEYLPKRKIKERIFAVKDSIDLIEKLITDHHICFIAELAKYPTNKLKETTGHSLVYTAYLSILVIQDNKEESMRVSLDDNQLTLYCFQLGELAELINRIKSRVLAYAIDWITFVDSGWSSPTELSSLIAENNAESLRVVAQMTSRTGQAP